MHNLSVYLWDLRTIPLWSKWTKDLTLYCLNKIKEIMILLLQNSRKPVRQTILLIGIIWWVQFQSSNKVSNNTWIYVYIKKLDKISTPIPTPTLESFNSNSNSGSFNSNSNSGQSPEYQLQLQLQLREFQLQLQLQLQLRQVSWISTPTPTPTPEVSTPIPTPTPELELELNPTPTPTPELTPTLIESRYCYAYTQNYMNVCKVLLMICSQTPTVYRIPCFHLYHQNSMHGNQNHFVHVCLFLKVETGDAELGLE